MQMIKYWFYGLLIMGVTSCATTSSSPVTYDINRFDAEIQAFEDFDSRARYRANMIVFTGSSSIRFWNTLTEDMNPMPVVNRGFGGSTLPEVLQYYDRIITHFQPSAIVLYCGENDIALGRSPSDVYSDYIAFVKKTRAALPGTPIIYLSMKPSPARWLMWAQFQEGNAMIKAYADQYEDLQYIDVSELMLDAGGVPKASIFIKDMLHMNPQGYTFWNYMIRPTVEQVYKSATK